MGDVKESLATQITPETPDSPVTLNIWRRNVDMYYIFGHEIDTLGSASQRFSLDTAILGIAVGAAVSLWATILTVDIAKPKIYAAFWAVALLFTLMAVYFAVKAAIDWRDSRKQIEDIKKQSAGREVSGKV